MRIDLPSNFFIKTSRIHNFLEGGGYMTYMAVYEGVNKGVSLNSTLVFVAAANSVIALIGCFLLSR